MAKEIDEGIKWIDANVKDNPLVRILEVPAFYITAFWLINGMASLSFEDSKVLIINAPANSRSLERLKLYDSSVFLDLLRKEPMAMGFSP